MTRYPTRNGIAIPPYELSLPGSRLDLGNTRNFNNHHNEWTRRTMGRLTVTQTLRDLARLQFILPKDVHERLHRTYEPPMLPTIAQAIDEIMDAYENGESLKVLQTRHYVEVGITEQLIQHIKNEKGRQ